MDYRSEVAAIRSKRDRDIAHLRWAAARDIESLSERRDAEIHRLRALGMTFPAIATRLGYSCPQVQEIASGKRDEYNRRRREHWHLIAGGKAAYSAP